MATTYDRLVILKNDQELEEAIVGWHSNTIIEMWLHNTAFDKEEMAS